MHVGLFKAETNLTNKDIEGSSPQCVKFKSIRSGTNPLDPVYQLSHVEYRPATPPKFIRDQMRVDDIEKAQPKKETFAAIKTKHTMKVDDIEGTHARARVFNRPRDTNFSTINYNDVTRSGRNNSRCTNPLMPVYRHRDENN